VSAVTTNAPPPDPDQISVNEGFQRLWRHFRGPHVAREHFNTALLSNDIRLWVWDDDRETYVVVDPNFIETHMRVTARPAADGQWSAELEAFRGFFAGAPRWKVSASGVDRVIKADEESKRRHAGGRKPKYDRETVLIEAAYFLREKGNIPAKYGVTQLADELALILDNCPDRTLLIEIVGPLLNRFKSES
jgi:hypothetical protein